MSSLETEILVTDLNSGAVFSRISGHELRTLHSFSGSRSGPPPDSRPHRQTIRTHNLRPPFWISPATDMYGFRADDFQRWVARHRGLSQRQGRDALSSWIHRTDCKIHSRRCQRNERLANMGGTRQEFDEESQAALCGRGSWPGFGQHDLRARLHNHRLVADAFSVGGLPPNQGVSSFIPKSICADRFRPVFALQVRGSTMWDGSTVCCSKQEPSISWIVATWISIVLS